MNLPVEIQEYILRYIINISDIASCMQTCSIWYNITRRLNAVFNKQFVSNPYKYTYRLLSRDNYALAIDSARDPIKRLQFDPSIGEILRLLRRKLELELSKYITTYIGPSQKEPIVYALNGTITTIIYTPYDTVEIRITPGCKSIYCTMQSTRRIFRIYENDTVFDIGLIERYLNTPIGEIVNVYKLLANKYFQSV